MSPAAGTITGRVFQITATRVEIELAENSACTTCSLSIVCKPGKEQQRRISLPNPGDLHANQIVHLEENSSLTLKLAALQYGVPLVGFLIGIFGIYALDGGPLWATLGGLVGLAAGAGIAYARIRYWVTSRTPQFFRILSS